MQFQSVEFFGRNGQTDYKFICNCEGAKIDKTILKIKNKVGQVTDSLRITLF